MWRPVQCSNLGADLFLVEPQEIPESEVWAFLPGDVVRCSLRSFSGGEVLLAVEAAVPEEHQTIRDWLELHDSVVFPESFGRDDELKVNGVIHRWQSRAGVTFGLGLEQTVAFRFSGLVHDVNFPPNHGQVDYAAS